MSSHAFPTDDEDAALVMGAMDTVMAGTIGPEQFTAFERACARLDRDGHGFDLDPDLFPSLRPRAEAVRRGQRRGRRGDAIFYALVGVFVAYLLLLVSGALSRGAPDLGESIRSDMLMKRELA